MKKVCLSLSVLLLALACPVRADMVIYSGSFNVGGVIPDGSLVGFANSQTLSGLSSAPISDVNVTLNLSGGWNGDLYAYLVHESGFAVLLNRVGAASGNNTGYGNAGMNVLLSDGGALGDIHTYGGAGVPTGEYAPDGRYVDPRSSGATIGGTLRTALLSSFNGGNANGTWTLYLADVSGGDQSTLNSWGLEIAAVPEPRSLVEGTIAALFLGGVIGFYRLKGPKPVRC